MNTSKRLHSRSPRVRSHRLQRSCVEALEQRWLLSGNLAMQAGAIVDQNDNILGSESPGQRVFLHAFYTGADLNSSATYRFDITLNGMTESTNYTSQGANVSGSHNYGYFWGQFVVSPGVNLVTMTVDPDHTVAETNFNDNTISFQFTAGSTNVGSMSYSVSQMRAAYGLNNLSPFGSTAADGTGQTIAIVDEYNDPNILNDVDGFDTHMHMTSNTSSTLYDLYGGTNSFITVYNQNGTNITANIANSGTGGVPIVDPAGNWAGEETMDVEWAHAMAPGAHIDIIETVGGSSNFGGLFVGADEATIIPNVSVVSMSWSWAEGNWAGSGGSGETAMDSNTFATPGGHTPITFVASSADGGQPSGYPSYSPNVISVGGTELNISSNTYGSEIGWNFPTPTKVVFYGGTGFSKTGTWTQQNGGYSGTYATATASSGSVATWTTPITSSDRGWQNGVEVTSSWVGSPSDATNAVFKIYNGTGTSGTLLGTVNVDQTPSSGGTQLGTAAFQDLGTFFPSSDGSGNGSITVTLSTSGSNGTVSAGAVGIAPDWASGGGQSVYESEPTYQQSVQSSGKRQTPDVSMDGSINSGVTCFQNNGLYFAYAGTSLSAPMWAGIMAIVDQGRVAAGLSAFNPASNPTQALQAIYKLPSSDFHDITNAYNGFFGGNGYDLITGRGSPMADKIIPDLVTFGVLPTVTASTFNYANNPSSVSMTFNETLGSTFTVSDVTLQNLTTGQSVANGSISLTLSSGQYFVSFPGYTHGELPDGNYRLTLPAGSVANATGDQLAANYTFDFFVLAGDANRDRAVNAADLNILNANFGQSGKTFAQGDFNYDGMVDSNDLSIYNTQKLMLLPPQGPVALGATSGADSYYLKRESTTLVDVTANGHTTPDFRMFVGAITGFLQFQGGSGADTLTLDYSNGALLSAGVTINYDGGADGDTLNVIGSAAADGVSFSSSGLSINGATITTANVETLTFDGLGGFDALSIDGGPTVTIQHPQHFASLNIGENAGASVLPGGASPIVTRALGMAEIAKLDLNDNDLMLNDDNTSYLSNVQGWINSGRAGGAWNGDGIISSAAKNNPKHTTTLGAMGAFDYERIYSFQAKFAGDPIENNAVLVKYTYYGDTDFNGKVDGSDYAKIDQKYAAQTFGHPIGGWVNGDTDGNGQIDGSDYALIDIAYGSQGQPINPPIVHPASKPGKMVDQIDL